MAGTSRAEKKYQFLKLMHSGRSLKEIKALQKSASVALDDEYAKGKQKQSLLSLAVGWKSLTREGARDIMLVRFTPKSTLPATREEYMAQWVTTDAPIKPLNWKRDGNLVRQGRPNAPRPGSSAGKVAPTSIKGATKVLKDMQVLVRTLQGLVQKYGKGNIKGIQKQFRIIRKGIPKG